MDGNVMMLFTSLDNGGESKFLLIAAVKGKLHNWQTNNTNKVEWTLKLSYSLLNGMK